jgi:hypothetical protein
VFEEGGHEGEMVGVVEFGGVAFCELVGTVAAPGRP